MAEPPFRMIPDWNRLRRRYESFWRNDVTDGAIIAHIQNPSPRRPAPEPWMLEASEEKYLNPDKLFRLKQWRKTYWSWHADLFQYTLPSYGVAIFTSFCGGRPGFGADTVWYEPVISGLDEADRIHFDPDGRLWKSHLEAIACFAERCHGEQILGLSDLGGPTDWIAGLMGTENFLLAAIEHPDRMREFALRLAQESCAAFDVIARLIVPRTDGYANWMPLWSGRPLGTVQDDMAINLSPVLYRDVFAPALKLRAAHTERTVAHWHDGCSQHLDTLLAFEEITAVQYGHDPNSPPFRSLIEPMRRIQSAGKKLFISCVEAPDAEFFIRHLDPRGLMMIIDAPDEESSRKMLDDVARWTEERLASLGEPQGSAKGEPDRMTARAQERSGVS